jgi:hypothetical protein
VRSLAVLVLAAAGFLGFLAHAHRTGSAARGGEEAVLARLRAPPADDGAVGGYRLRWARGDGLPPLLVASPERVPEDGVRWFAAPGGGEVFQFDTVLFRAPAGGPDARPLRAWLASGREPSRLPPGWARAD